MTSELTNQLASELLISALLGVLALAILTISLVMFLVRRKRSAGYEKLAYRKSEGALARSYQPSVFENACRWLVVKTTKVDAVQSALGLHNPIPCSWGEAVSRSTPRELFVSPPIRGWILVIGQGLPDPSEDIDRCYHFIIKLSRALGHVQFYSAHRALNHHAWVRAERGQIRRAYAWSGATLWNQGPVSQAERDLALKCYDYDERPSVELTSGAAVIPNAERITQLASRWSFDPSTVNESVLRVGLGVAGDLSHSRHP
jgi:hypothetical protein